MSDRYAPVTPVTFRHSDDFVTENMPSRPSRAPIRGVTSVTLSILVPMPLFASGGQTAAQLLCSLSQKIQGVAHG